VKTSTVCFAFLMLVTISVMAQDSTCAIFETEEIACNDAPYKACSSRAALSGVIVGGGTDFGCNHPVTQPLTCPGGSSCPSTTYQLVSVSNPYCEQTYTECGCLDCGGGGGGGQDCSCDGTPPVCPPEECDLIEQAPKSGKPSVEGRNAARVERNIVAADHRLN